MQDETKFNLLRGRTLTKASAVTKSTRRDFTGKESENLVAVKIEGIKIICYYVH